MKATKKMIGEGREEKRREKPLLFEIRTRNTPKNHLLRWLSFLLNWLHNFEQISSPFPFHDRSIPILLYGNDSLRGWRLKGKGKGVLGKGVLGARELFQRSLSLPLQTPATQAMETRLESTNHNTGFVGAKIRFVFGGVHSHIASLSGRIFLLFSSKICGVLPPDYVCNERYHKSDLYFLAERPREFSREGHFCFFRGSELAEEANSQASFLA